MRRLMELEANLAEQDAEDAARVAAAERRLSEAVLRKGELERALGQELREARVALQRRLRAVEAEARRAVAEAEQRARAEELAAVAAEEALSRAEWHRDQVYRQVSAFSKHAQHLSVLAAERAAQAGERAGRLVERVHLESLERVLAVEDFVACEAPRLAAVSLLPGLKAGGAPLAPPAALAR